MILTLKKHRTISERYIYKKKKRLYSPEINSIAPKFVLLVWIRERKEAHRFFTTEMKQEQRERERERSSYLTKERINNLQPNNKNKATRVKKNPASKFNDNKRVPLNYFLKSGKERETKKNSRIVQIAPCKGKNRITRNSLT